MSGRAHEDMGKADHAPLRALLTRSRVAPDYTMGALAERTGISQDTLRSWERRYDFPRPQRTPTNRRLYAERDLIAIGWILDETRRGQGVREAISIVEAVIADLTAEHDDTVPQPDEPGLLSAFIGHLLVADLAGSQSAWDDLALAMSPDALGERVILPAMATLSDDAASAIAFLHRKAIVLFDAAGPERGKLSVALVLDGGERAAIAGAVLAARLSREGFRIFTPFADVRDMVALTGLRRTRPDRLVLAHAGQGECDLADTIRAITGVDVVVPWRPSIAEPLDRLIATIRHT